MKKRINISVIGAHICGKKTQDLAYRMGVKIAEQGWTLICGGAGGVMKAACSGAKSAGGLTVGILPESNCEEANDFLDVCIPTGLGYARNILVVRSSLAVVAFSGKYGTLSEIAFALNEGKKVYSLYPWEINGIKQCQSPEDVIKKIKKQLAI